MPVIADFCSTTIEDRPHFAADEPLQNLARFSFDWAHVTCGENAPCRRYHKTWSTIRYLGAGGALPAAAQLFETAIAKNLAGKKLSLLISGSADTSLLAITHNASRLAGVAPTVSFIDQCQTTVDQNRLYARYLNLDGQFTRIDARQISNASYDMILAHNFLYFFDATGIRDLMKAWSNVLKADGQIIMCQVVRDGGASNWSRGQTPDIDEKLDQIRAQALEKQYAQHEIDSILKACHEFWQEKMNGNPVTSDIALTAMADAGLVIKNCIRVDDLNVSSPAMVRRSAETAHAKYFLILGKVDPGPT